ncbi:hypothetical protein G3578_03405 [Brevibacillus sp. SYP-B805]|uniref:WG repeat-containing protein n=1 Tax=Brevibacillus sp. SYP-B805 TaxID=1578199 RepID=UPI0013ED619C|nr:WG repeat-containing protein [Brevibacillus sp. SYP-B805]NGQ94220.1 hypothetical protein [Brevibacillus sp. SYP-B805]
MKKYVSALLFIAMLFGIMPMAAAEEDHEYLPYDMVGSISEGLAWYLDISMDMENGMEKEQYGFIDTNGKVVIKAIYEEVSGFNEGLAAVKKNGKWGYIDKTGKEVVSPQYDAVALKFSEGFAQVQKNKKWGYVDQFGKEAIPLRYEDTNSFGEGLAHVKKNHKVGYIDQTGKEVITPQYEDGHVFKDGLAPVKKNGKWGFIDKTGKEVITFQYEDAYSFKEGLAPVKKNGKWGFINTKGIEVVKPKYSEVHHFSEGFASVRVGNKMGFIDKKGTEVIRLQYVANNLDDSVFDFSEGLAGVVKLNRNGDEVFGYIDKSGKEVLGFDTPEFWGTPFRGGFAVVSDAGQRSYYIIANPLTDDQSTVHSITVSPTNVSLKPGKTNQLTVTATMSDKTKKDVTKASTGTVYTSSDEKVAKVSKDGKVTVAKTAKKGDKATITVENNGKTAKVSVKVL